MEKRSLNFRYFIILNYNKMEHILYIEKRAGKGCNCKNGYFWSGFTPDGIFRKFIVSEKIWVECGNGVNYI